MNNIRYSSIRSLDVSNGENVGVSLFVQGCHFHCNNCFNKETWDFNGGKEWTEEIEKQFLELAARPYIKRISILGGEPLADENLDGVLNLVNRIRLLFGDTKTIWLYTGYKVKDINKKQIFIEPNVFTNNINITLEHNYVGAFLFTDKFNKDIKRSDIIKQCDVLVDDRYIDSKRDITLKWRGSSNQRVIDIQKSLQKGKIVLWQT